MSGNQLDRARIKLMLTCLKHARIESVFTHAPASTIHGNLPVHRLPSSLLLLLL